MMRYSLPKALPLLLLLSMACFLPLLAQEEEEVDYGPFMEPIPEELGVMIDIALGENPEIQVAEAEVRAAAAALRRQQLEVIEEVTNVFQERRRIREGLEQLAEKEEALDRALKDAADQEAEELVEILGKVRAERMELDAGAAEVNARARYLLGMGIGTPHLDGEAHFEMPRRPAPRPARTAEQEALLGKVIKLPGERMPLMDIIALLREHGGVSLIASLEIGLEAPVFVPGGEGLTLEKLLLAITDQHPHMCAILRDYGVLITHQEAARTLLAPAIPADTPLFVPEFPPEREEE